MPKREETLERFLTRVVIALVRKYGQQENGELDIPWSEVEKVKEGDGLTYCNDEESHCFSFREVVQGAEVFFVGPTKEEAWARSRSDLLKSKSGEQPLTSAILSDERVLEKERELLTRQKIRDRGLASQAAKKAGLFPWSGRSERDFAP